MSSKLKLCMIGAGGHATANIYPQFAYLDADVVANADLDDEKARDRARRFGIPKTYTDYIEMIETEKPDGVVVCVGPKFHPAASIEIMKRGVNVYTEKPNAVSLEESEKVLKTQKETGLVCMTAYKKRFAPAYRKAKELIESDDFGEPSLITLLRTKGPGDPGYMLDWGCHVLDIMRYLFGEVDSILAIRSAETNESVTVTFRFSNGAVGNLSVSDRPGRVFEDIYIAGTGGVSIKTQNSIRMQAYKMGQVLSDHEPMFTNANPGIRETGFLPELQEFVAAISEKRMPESSILSATRTMAVYDAVCRSLESSEWVEVKKV